MQIIQRHIEVQPGIDITSVWAIPDHFAPGQTDAIILAHGAGNDMSHPFICYFHEALAEAGLLSIKFNFPYTEQGRKAPDRPALLERTWVAVANARHGARANCSWGVRAWAAVLHHWPLPRGCPVMG